MTNPINTLTVPSVSITTARTGVMPAPAKKAVSLQALQSLLKYVGPVVPIDAMRVTDDQG